jgi:nitrous oxide reductase accessory protein NosL
MKQTFFLIVLSALLYAGAAAAQAGESPVPAAVQTGQSPASEPAGVKAAEASGKKKTVRRAPRGPARPRLFWLRRTTA